MPSGNQKEAGLPFYVTGVGINDAQLSCSSECERFFIVSEGCAGIRIENENYELAKGSVCWLSGSRTEMPEICTPSSKISWITFTSSVPAPSELFISASHAVFSLSDLPAAAAMFRSVYDALSLDPAYGGFTASACLYQLIIRLNRDASAIPDTRHRMNPAINAALDYISENYAEVITLEKLCQAAGGLSEQYLCRLFKQNTGMRPMEYILKKRISAARGYLENTDMPISEVAKITGFNNTSYFYRNFKKFTGMSPLICRQNAFSKKDTNI